MADNASTVCLAHLFTYQDFDEGTLGLAYVAPSKAQALGGLCPKRKDPRLPAAQCGETQAGVVDCLHTDVRTLGQDLRSEVCMSFHLDDNINNPGGFLSRFCRPSQLPAPMNFSPDTVCCDSLLQRVNNKSPPLFFTQHITLRRWPRRRATSTRG